RHCRGRPRADPRPGGGRGAVRRHRGDAPRAHQTDRAPPLHPDDQRHPRARFRAMTTAPRALLSAYDKTGIVDLARGLVDLGWELVSSGGTAKVIADAGIPVLDVADVTGSPIMLGHRVVT